MRIKRIPSSEVDDQELVQVARTAARDAAEILRIATPIIQWVRCNAHEKAIGWVYPWLNAVHLDADWCKLMGAEQTTALVYHEARHIWQEVNHRYNAPGYKRQSEDDAESFSFRHTRTMIERPDYKWRYQDYA